MENRSLDRFREIVVIKIVSKNVDKILKKIYGMRITIHDVKYISRKEIHLKIYFKDYKIIKDFKLIEEISIIESFGKLRLKEVIFKNKILFTAILIGYLLLLFLSNIIFKIEVIHSDSDLRKYVVEVLKENGLTTFTYRKSYNELQKIKEKILEENKNKIEWLEIDRVGTRYIIKLEERRKESKKEEYIYQDIISTKTAIIKDIEAENGVIMRKVNDLVTNGDVIISGNIYKNDEIVNVVKASGKIYGEVWYNIKVEFPLILDIKEETGKSKNIYSINFLNLNIPLFDFNSYKYKTIKQEKTLYNKLLPIYISKEKQYELKVINGIYSTGEAIIEAEKYAREKMNMQLDDDEYIIRSRVLSYDVQNEKINLEMFFTIYENITGTREIVENKKEV